MRPIDWLLLLIASDGAPRGLDPVRIQKGMFLLAREGAAPAAQSYEFEPYNYGPMSRGVYRDVARLLAAGLVERRPVPGYGWAIYVPTDAGGERASGLAARAGAEAPATLSALAEIKRTITGVSFAALLESIYARYPEYAARSVFRRP
jgi:hypothetical protein